MTRRDLARLPLASLVLALAGCGAREPTPATERPAAPTPAAAPAPAAAPIALREVVFEGMCDASAAVSLSDTRFLVADDEDNILRVYDAEAGGAPVAQTDLSAALGIPLKGKKHPKAPEMDLEAGTKLGDRAFWLASHGRNKAGKVKPERLQFFATTAADPIAVSGKPYDHLQPDLIAAPAMAPFGLAAAAELAPKAEGGFNLEGLTATPEGTLLLGLRNPIPGGKALLVTLENPDDLVAGRGPARFGAPRQIDLGGRGVRSLSWWRGRYLVVGGHWAEGGVSALYTWDGTGEATAIPGLDLTTYNPEGFFTPEGRDEILLVSDDGSVAVNGVPCKELPDSTTKRFRGVWLTPPAAPAPALDGAAKTR